MSKKAKIAKLKEQNRQLRRQIRISHPGSLKDLGFNLHESIGREKAAIERADEKYGRPETDRKLAALEVLDKHRRTIQEKLKKVLKWNEGR